jgi:pimeloyl-ACP methyl ester carboxylesterase
MIRMARPALGPANGSGPVDSPPVRPEGRTGAHPEPHLREESALVLGTRLAYWRSTVDHDDVVVLLHGLLSDHTGLLDLAADLHGVTIVIPDLPGFGRSAPLRGPHSMDGYASALEELRQHLGLARFTLLGHSLGGSIALAYAGRYPTALDALCLLNPVFMPDTRTARLGKLYYDRCARLPRPLDRLLLTSRLAVYLSDRAVFTTKDRAIRRRTLRQDYATARMATIRAVRESYLSIFDTPFDRYAAAVTARTLLVTGEHDWMSTPRLLSRLPWGNADSTHVEIVADAGHLIPAEQPKLAARLVNRFLAGDDPRRAASGAVRVPPD